MKLFLAFLIGAFIGSVHSRNLFLQDGKQYTYKTEVSAAAGTMDYATASSGFSYKCTTQIQVSGQTMNIRLSDLTFSQYVGMHDAGSWPYDNTNYTPVPGQGYEYQFSVTQGDDGLFKELEVDSRANVYVRNIARSWAAQLQVNTQEIKKGLKSFRSKEQVLQGECEISYAGSKNSIVKTVSHTDDCTNRVYRIADDYRGYRCDWETTNKGMGFPSSLATTIMVLDDNKDGTFNVKRIGAASTFVAQFYEEEGAAHFVHTNQTSELVSVSSSPGDISVSGRKINDLSYEFADAEYKWNVDRDLKAVEPLLTVPLEVENSQEELKAAIKKGIIFQKTIVTANTPDKELLQKAHKFGIGNLISLTYAMDYNSLKSVADELLADKSEKGVMMSNVYGELLGSAGSTAAALVIRDLILENKFDNERDAARILSGIPFHIKRPNTQLVKEMEKLLDAGQTGFVKMSVPLVLGHLIRMTCERAGTPFSEPSMQCFKEFAPQYINKLMDRYKGSSDREEKSVIIAALSNIRFGGVTEALKPIVLGEMDGDDMQLRTAAMWAAVWEAEVKGIAKDVAKAIFVDQSLSHELRISALEVIMFSKPKAADLSTVLAILYKEPDYEVFNYAYSLLERWGNSINPCNRQTADLARYFGKYLKQYSSYETDMGFGISKTTFREFQKKKYGYGGGAVAYVVGSHQSTTPVSVGFTVNYNMMGKYQSEIIGVHLRLEGLAKHLIKKFKKTDPNTWKTADLEDILKNQMGIREREDQPVRCQISIYLKNTIIFHRLYDESDMMPGGKLRNFMDKIKDAGEQYVINHQRAAQIGSLIYEQPTGIGFPMMIYSSVTGLWSLKAQVERGNSRGLLYRDVTYDANALVQGMRAAAIIHPWRKAGYGIIQSRLYRTNIPRRVMIGVNPVKRELKFSVSRPKYDKPWQITMHAQTMVVVRGHNVDGSFNGLKDNCPTCETAVIVSRGPQAIKEREIINHENQKLGYNVYGKYFGCEMDISRGNTVKHLIGSFLPYNKRPKTPYNSLVMGIRQIRAFLFHYPKVEQCGAMLRWSQSKNNPVKEIEVSIRANMEKNGERLFFRGRKWFIKALVKAKGEPEDRAYRINLAVETTPGNLQNKIKLQVNRAPVASIGIKPYSVCFALENQFPEFSKEFLGWDNSRQMSVTGKAMLQYGASTSCSDAEGEIRVKFAHSTTAEAREEMKNKWYYKKCMESKNSPAWRGRKDTMPVTEPCFMTVYDATSARKYTWNIEFVKLTNRMQNLISKIGVAMKAGLLPYWDTDPDNVDTDGEIGPFLNLAVTLKNNEKNADVRIETRKGEEDYSDVPLSLNWSKRLRNLKFTKTLQTLYYAKIINPCIVTNSDIRTNDNVTLSYQPTSCWTLNSASCGSTPQYAVFSKEVGGKLAAMVYVGGHTVELTPSGSGTEIKVNGEVKTLAEGQDELEITQDGVEVFEIFRWGSSYHVYSFLRVWVSYDGNFVETVPAPSTKGQHCGICGNYNRNKFDELEGKAGNQMGDMASFVKEWQWKC